MQGEDDGGFAVITAGAALQPFADADGADFPGQHGQAALFADNHIAEIFCRARTAHAFHQNFLRTFDQHTRRAIFARAAHGFGDIVDANTAQRELRGIEQQLHLPLIAADGHDVSDSGYAKKAALDRPVGYAFDLHRGMAGRSQRNEHDFAHHRRGWRHVRRGQVIGQFVAHGLQAFRNNLACFGGVGRPTEFERHHAEAGRRVGPDAPQSGGTVERGFERDSDALLDFGRRITSGINHHGHRRRGQIGQHIDRRAQRQHEAAEREQ